MRLSTSTIAMMARIPERVNEYIPCVLRHCERGREVCLLNMVRSISKPIKIVPIVNHVAPCDTDSATNAFADDETAAARDSLRRVVVLAAGAGADARWLTRLRR